MSVLLQIELQPLPNRLSFSVLLSQHIVSHFTVRLSFYAAFITGLLNNIGTHVDPIILIQKIREGLEIPGLRNSLVQILHDYYLQVKC